MNEPIAMDLALSWTSSRDSAGDAETTWTKWVAGLSDGTRSVLTESGRDGGSTYQEMYVSGRISLGAIMLELFTLEAAT